MAEKKSKRKSIKDKYNISLANIELYSINGQQLQTDTIKSNELIRNNSIDIHDINGNIIKLRLTEKLFFKPEGPFKLDLDIIGTYEAQMKIQKEDIENDLEDLGVPLLAYSSLIVALITERFVTLPLILPPIRSNDSN